MSAPEPKQAASERDTRDFLGGPVVRNPPANAGDTDLIPVQEDSACRGAINPVHHSY